MLRNALKITFIKLCNCFYFGKDKNVNKYIDDLDVQSNGFINTAENKIILVAENFYIIV